jgi:hypothetical protein
MLDDGCCLKNPTVEIKNLPVPIFQFEALFSMVPNRILQPK